MFNSVSPPLTPQHSTPSTNFLQTSLMAVADLFSFFTVTYPVGTWLCVSNQISRHLFLTHLSLTVKVNLNAELRFGHHPSCVFIFFANFLHPLWRTNRSPSGLWRFFTLPLLDILQMWIFSKAISPHQPYISQNSCHLLQRLYLCRDGLSFRVRRL